MAVFKKNCTRFAPAWGLYLLGLFMVLGIMSDGSNFGIYFARDLTALMTGFAAINFGYALVVAQLLFGDLYNARMCNALHALPLRREGWFVTHVLSGLMFSLAPNLVMTGLSMILSGSFWQISLLWLAVMTLQYLFFFGVAVLSAYLSGSRFAMALQYIIFNGFALIALWLMKSIYEDQLYGIVLREQSFYRFSPVLFLSTVTFVNIPYDNQPFTLIGDSWGYLAVCAAIGVAAMALALLCYRKRHLECAGDFVAVKGLGPVFLVLYTLCGGACCQGFFDLFLGEGGIVYLLLGLAIGFFTGLMLLQRQIRVFSLKNILAFAGVLVLFGCSILACRMDLFGAVRWVPQQTQVASVQLSTGSSFYYRENTAKLTDPQDIQDFLEVHRYGLEHRGEGLDGQPDVRLYGTYTMKNGTQRSRYYYINKDSVPGTQLRNWLSRAETVLPADWGTLTRIEIYGDEETREITDPAELASLVEAIRADCAVGVMAQDGNFYNNYETYFIGLRYTDPQGLQRQKELRFWEGCLNFTAWCRAHNLNLGSKY